MSIVIRFSYLDYLKNKQQSEKNKGKNGLKLGFELNILFKIPIQLQEILIQVRR